MSTKVIDGGTLTLANGDKLMLTGEEMKTFLSSTKSTTVCDGPRCASRHGADSPVQYELDQELIRKDPAAMPDSFARFNKWLPYALEDTLVEFCGVRCLKDWIDYVYVEPLSPREKAARAENNSAVDAKVSRFDQEPVSQADGDAIAPYLIEPDITPEYIGGGN